MGLRRKPYNPCQKKEWEQLRIKLMNWKIERKYLFCGYKDEKYKRTHKKMEYKYKCSNI